MGIFINIHLMMYLQLTWMQVILAPFSNAIIFSFVSYCAHHFVQYNMYVYIIYC